METVAVLDFETTGLSPGMGDRPTEIAIALVAGGRIVDRYQSLMNPQRWIPAQVVALTGITNEMASEAPSVDTVMREAARFVGRRPIVAHNASFDQRFWSAELRRLDQEADGPFACTMLIARRLYPQIPNHRLGTLAQNLNLPVTGRAHRAMADVETATHLWLRMAEDLRVQWGVRNPCHELFRRVQRANRRQLHTLLSGTA